MPVGSFALFVSDSPSVASVIPSNMHGWTDWDESGTLGYVKIDSDNIVTEANSNFTLAEAGRWLIIWRVRYNQTVSSELSILMRARGGPDGNILQDALCGSYSRSLLDGKNSLGGQFIYDAESPNHIINFQRFIGTPGDLSGFWEPSHTSFCFIKLSDSTAYASYRNVASSDGYQGQVWRNVSWNGITTESNTDVIRRRSDGTNSQIDIMGTIGDKFLVTVSVALANSGTSRTGRIGQFQFGGSTLDNSRCACILRKVSTGDNCLNIMVLVEKKSNDTEILSFQMQRGTAQVNGTVFRFRSRLDIWAIPAGVETTMLTDSIAGQNLIATPVTLNAARTVSPDGSQSTGTFSNPYPEALLINSNNPFLVWANVAGERSANPQRLTRLAVMSLNGVEYLYGSHGTYPRGDEGMMRGVLDGSMHPYMLENLLSTGGMGIARVEVLDDGSDGSGTCPTLPNQVGMFGINLETLRSSVPGTYRLSGIIRNKEGFVLPNARVVLLKKDNGMGGRDSKFYTIVDHQTSDEQGGYDFNPVADNDPLYMVYAISDDNSNEDDDESGTAAGIRGVTNDNLQPEYVVGQ